MIIHSRGLALLVEFASGGLSAGWIVMLLHESVCLQADGFCALTTIMTSVVIAFFFQAEAGIRDLTVTGVQTCALPISARRVRQAHDVHRSPGGPSRYIVHADSLADTGAVYVMSLSDTTGGKMFFSVGGTVRSGERRVGEEGRSRWAPYHLIKKNEMLSS